jgi:LysR family transcriptional regulator, glycine cleavage system transcriptional activator
MTDASAQVKHRRPLDVTAGIGARPSALPQQIEAHSDASATRGRRDLGARRIAMRRLPSLDTLRVFTVAARHLSFTKAANELHLTQSAISHRVHALEDELGMPLFTRLTRRLELTRAGRSLAQRVDRAVGDIARAVADLDERSDERRLTVTSSSSVASRWLVPRLPRFHASHPDIELQVIANPSLLDLRSAGIDVAIRFGRGGYPGYTETRLMPDSVFPVCSPHLVARHGPVRSIEELLNLPLLHDSRTEADGSGSDWRSWLNHLGRGDLESSNGQRYSEAGLLIEAAMLGLGVALGRASLVSNLVADGTLVCPLPLSAPTAFSYYLLVLPEAALQPKILRFREWLQAEAAATVADTEQRG